MRVGYCIKHLQATAIEAGLDLDVYEEELALRRERLVERQAKAR